MIVKCKNCGKSFNKLPSQINRSPNHFCSRSCAISQNNKNPRQRVKPKQSTLDKYSSCMRCGKTMDYKKRRMRCDECSTPDYTLAEIQYDQHHTSSAWALVRSRARAIVKEREQICSKCGYDKHVECCHVIPISKFSLDVKVSEVNSENNLILLCPNCHWEYDHGYF